MNDKDIHELDKDIDEFQKKTTKDVNLTKPPVTPSIEEREGTTTTKSGNSNGLTERDVKELANQLKESLERLSMSKDKLTRLEAEEEKGLYGLTNPKMTVVVQGMTNTFVQLMEQQGLTKVPNYVPIKILFMSILFVLVDIVKNTKINPAAQIDVMSAVCSNVTMLFKLTLDECHPTIKDAMTRIIPTTFKTLITDDKLNEFSNIQDGKERTTKILNEIIKDVLEVQENKFKEKSLDPKKFWKDDIYKRD